MNDWQAIQQHALTLYISNILQRNVNIVDLGGREIISVIEFLSGVKHKQTRVRASVCSKMQEYEVANEAIKFLKEQGLLSVSIESENIVNHDIKTLTALFVEIVKKYNKLTRNETKEVLEWVRNLTGVNTTTFKDWTDGTLLKSLLKSERPFELFNSLGICRVVEDNKLGIEELSSTMQIKFIFDKRDNVEMHRFEVNQTNTARTVIVQTAEIITDDSSETTQNNKDVFSQTADPKIEIDLSCSLHNQRELLEENSEKNRDMPVTENQLLKTADLGKTQKKENYLQFNKEKQHENREENGQWTNTYKSIRFHLGEVKSLTKKTAQSKNGKAGTVSENTMDAEGRTNNDIEKLTPGFVNESETTEEDEDTCEFEIEDIEVDEFGKEEIKAARTRKLQEIERMRNDENKIEKPTSQEYINVYSIQQQMIEKSAADYLDKIQPSETAKDSSEQIEKSEESKETQTEIIKEVKTPKLTKIDKMMIAQEKKRRLRDVNCLVDRYIDNIKEWVDVSSYTIKYDSSKHGLTSLAFNTKTARCPNLMILVITTEGLSFGCFSHKIFPRSPKKGHSYVKNDNDFFIFSFNTTAGENPLKIKRKKKGKSVSVWSQHSRSVVFSIKRFVTINQKDQQSTFCKDLFESEYEDVSKRGVVAFTGRLAFDVDKVVALEWS
ncbi:hypothetical protein EIN_184980 [Entamoeba invadens IP1]|uniref:hypothetical protein n=1 Tax=Entamoeba invadens IP1 TaxID=370355 RepID=UPI0002C3EBEF|nr:hypothetical protein EIN_184980 [Entamoeba invadens IP1]ELP94121.1 hypothetical protein EIN_184980 [Entamoeba invadens IP1]|eukprot:XP_004260892.1 hypothetical protein EIN_184980 [Entamoeba invadens IP1]